MSTSMSSKTKVAFVATVTESIVETSKKLTVAVDTLHSVADRAQYAAVDRVYNTVVELNNKFSDTLEEDKKILVSVMEELVKRTDIGEAFVSSAKKQLSETESIPKMAEVQKINAERDGSEVWDTSMASQLEDAIDSWGKARYDFINGFAEGFRKIEEEEFKNAVKPICKTTEEFTNSLVKATNRIEDALTELGISIDKFIGNVSDTTSSAKIDSADSIKPDLMGASI